MKRIIKNKKKLRFCVFRSNKHIYGQIIDDQKGITLVGLGDQSLKRGEGKSKTEKAKALGKKIAEEALKKGIKDVYFDRRRFKYHGRVRALAEGAREGGLIF